MSTLQGALMLTIVRQCPLCFFLKGKDNEWIPCDTQIKEALQQLCPLCARSKAAATHSETDPSSERRLNPAPA